MLVDVDVPVDAPVKTLVMLLVLVLVLGLLQVALLFPHVPMLPRWHAALAGGGSGGEKGDATKALAPHRLLVVVHPMLRRSAAVVMLQNMGGSRAATLPLVHRRCLETLPLENAWCMDKVVIA